MKELNAKQKRYLRTLAHKLKPVVIIGNAGITEGVINEISQSIEHHELIKVKINAPDRPSRLQMIQTICSETSSHLVFSIGHIAVLYRTARKPGILLPK